MVACPSQASTINGRASSVSPFRALPGRVRAWLHAWTDRRGSQGMVPPGAEPTSVRDLSPEFERFMHIGERLERGLEALKDIQWEIRENEARYRDLLDNQADVILRRDALGRLTFVNQAFCRLFALERATVLGRVFSPAVLAGDKATPLAPGAEMRQQRYVQLVETAHGPGWIEWEGLAAS